MEALTYSSKNKQNNKRRRPRWYEPFFVQPQHRVALTLGAAILCAYILSLIGIISVLDSQHDVRDFGITRRVQHVLERRPLFYDIPPGKWPVSIRNEELEVIDHPANPNIKWKVPRFWSKPIHNNRLMHRDVAMKIGTCSVPDEHGTLVRGADCPLHQRTIFIGIASYRDFQCRETIEYIYNRASFPDRIRVGVVDQIAEGIDDRCNEPIRPCAEDTNQAICRYKDQIDVVTLNASESVGPVPARHVGYRLYRGEFYAAQADAHLNFAVNWDMSLILELESTGNEMAVLSTYLSDVTGALDESGNVVKYDRPIMCNSYWKESLQHYHIHHSVQPEGPPIITGSPQLHPWWSAGFSFARGHFLMNVPYDLYQPMVFSGEEMSIAIRGFTVGYDFYTPEHSVCFHYYQENEETIKKRKNVPTFWENADAYEGSGVVGMRRLLGIVHLLPGEDPSSWDRREEETYGLGGVRQPEQFMDFLGINVKEHTIEGHLCRFVNTGEMHRMFTANLRHDGMGIDYSKIDYKWVDPDKNSSTEEDGDDDETKTDDDDGDDDGAELARQGAMVL